MNGLERVLVRALEDREFLDRLKKEDFDPGEEYELNEQERELLKTLRFIQGGQGIDAFVRASSEAAARLLPQLGAYAGGRWSREMTRAEPKLERVASKLERVEPKLQRVAPKLERVAPKLERVEPKLQRVAPKLERVEPKLERTAGKVERVAPKLERVASELERNR